ncbi:MAG: aspartate aminotransferase family protein [Chitinophagaceae bacterium]|nr:aspartate aminotransferase family protein [Chitinophagaceae bacterium]
MTNRQLFLHHCGQTSDAPLCFEIASAEGIYLYDDDGKKYIDAIGGISVANIGHGNAHVLAATKNQIDAYMHTMVYGEMVQSPQVQFAKLLTDYLPASLNAVFFTNSGAEATEGAMKLAKRITNRTKIIAFNNSYHGSTQGALSLIGDEYWRNAFRPLLPNIFHYNYNEDVVLDGIDETVACVILETVQAESGVYAARKEWLQAIDQKCKSTGTLLILDEAQCGFGRTGTLWAFEQYGIVPDILLLAKAIGGGMPLGAFIANKQLMDSLTHHPVLGHLSTFSGHPVSCAAGLAAMQELLKKNIIAEVENKGALLEKLLTDKGIKCIRRKGLWMALFFTDYETTKKIVDACIAKGVFTDWFLFASNALRISPPLIITEEQIVAMADVIGESVKEVIG